MFTFFCNHAIARNALQMSQAGSHLPENEGVTDPARLQYMVAATMFGDVCLGRYGGAVEIWERYAKPAGEGAAAYTNLIFQVALTRRR